MLRTAMGAFILASGLFAGSPAASQSAQEMASFCEPIVNAKAVGEGRIQVTTSFETGQCWGAFRALQQLSALTLDGKTRALPLCLPEETKLSQLVKIFYRHVQKKPAIGHEPFALVAFWVLWDAFPCPE